MIKGVIISACYSFSANEILKQIVQHSLIAEGKKKRDIFKFQFSSSLFVWLISHQPAVLFSQNKSDISNQPTVLFSQNKPAPAISHQPTEQPVSLCMFALNYIFLFALSSQ
jgi:hypothetical protein